MYPISKIGSKIILRYCLLLVTSIIYILELVSGSNCREEKILRSKGKVDQLGIYLVLVEEIIVYVHTTDDGDDNSGVSTYVHMRLPAMRGHIVPAPYFSFKHTEITNSRSLCMTFSMEEMAKAQVLQLP